MDPSGATDGAADILIENGRILSVGPAPGEAGLTIDAAGMIVCPGLLDIHVHLRDPGDPREETVETGARAAVAGGFTGIACMPNTDPPLDDPALVRSIAEKAAAAGLAGVHIIAACTMGREGEKIADMEALAAAGAAGFSDDGGWIHDRDLMKEILVRAKKLGLPVLSHCEDTSVSRSGVMHRGAVSDALGLPGIPARAENEAVARDIELAEETDARLHVMHVSTAAAADLIRKARTRGVKVTAEAAPHHLALTDEDVRSMDPRFKMNPPLRGADDREGLREGLADGTIDCIASDHAPHTAEEKARGFRDAPFGCIGLETVLPIALELVENGVISLTGALACLTCNPARVLGLDRGTLRPGAVADVTVFDPSEEWTVDVSTFESKSRNCPFQGRRVKGRAKHVIVAGQVKLPFP